MNQCDKLALKVYKPKYDLSETVNPWELCKIVGLNI